MIQKSDHKPRFADISGIHLKDIDIQFSVADLLNNDELLYASRSPALSKKDKCKATPRSHRNSQKKEASMQFKNAYLETNRTKKKRVQLKGKSTSTDHLQQKDTQDNSETVKATSYNLTPKEPIVKRLSKAELCPSPSQTKFMPNKYQPSKNPRSRTKSISSITPIRKKSQLYTEQSCRTPIMSHMSIEASQLKSSAQQSKSSLKRDRSRTFKSNHEELKAKNENIVFNDYFYENQKKHPEKVKGNAEKCMRKRSTSSGKKTEYLSRKLKTPSKIQEGLSPRTFRK